MKEIMDVVFILDKSGSMLNMVSDAVGGYNSLIKNTKKLDQEILVTTILFNDEVSVVHKRVPINEVKKMNDEDYIASGCTALLDAIGYAIDFMDDNKEDGKALFYITTDGMENSSREYNYKMINKMIKQHEKLGYEFNFLASNINPVEIGHKIGIKEGRCMSVSADSVGQARMYSMICDNIAKEVTSK